MAVVAMLAVVGNGGCFGGREGDCTTNASGRRLRFGRFLNRKLPDMLLQSTA